MKPKTDGDDDEGQYQDPDNEVGLFSAAPYEEDDEEADRVWDMIDARMDERRKARREAREQEELAKFRQERPKISQQFSDLKRQLSTLDEDEWAAIPEVGDLVGKSRKKSKVPERFTPLPDTVLAATRDQGQYSTTTNDDTSGMLTDFKEIGQARDKVLGLKLDQASTDSASGQTTIDPKGYLTDLNSVALKTATEIGDIKKARLLLNSVITTNPKHAPGWIAAARLEEAAGRPVHARNTIAKGCAQCPKNEDVWLESARLNVSQKWQRAKAGGANIVYFSSLDGGQCQDHSSRCCTVYSSIGQDLASCGEFGNRQQEQEEGPSACIRIYPQLSQAMANCDQHGRQP